MVLKSEHYLADTKVEQMESWLVGRLVESTVVMVVPMMVENLADTKVELKELISVVWKATTTVEN